MNISEIIKRQYGGYSKYHQSPTNLWIHIILVPVFILSFLSFIAALIQLSIFVAIISVLLMLTSIAIQGAGHNKEDIPTEAFTSAQNAIIRILLEQLYTFPKFVISGKWYKAIQQR